MHSKPESSLVMMSLLAWPKDPVVNLVVHNYLPALIKMIASCLPQWPLYQKILSRGRILQGFNCAFLNILCPWPRACSASCGTVRFSLDPTNFQEAVIVAAIGCFCWLSRQSGERGRRTVALAEVGIFTWESDHFEDRLWAFVTTTSTAPHAQQGRIIPQYGVAAGQEKLK